MRHLKGKKIFLICILILIIFITARYFLIIRDLNEVRDEFGLNNWTRSMYPFFSSTDTIKLLVDEDFEGELNFWWEGISGDFELNLLDDSNRLIYGIKNNKENKINKINLKNGKYKLIIKQKNFTGAIAIGYENMIRLTELDNKNFSYNNAKPEKGYNWDYIIYTPNEIKNSILLVCPNNSGIISNSYDIHVEKAKSLIKYKSKLADKLGVPLLVPIFPRFKKESHIYTHSLGRNCIYTDIKDIKRLDYQLIKMINDSKEILEKKEIVLEDKILMSGFSASGDFIDRFTLLHPYLVKAVVFGGSNTVVPLKELNDQKLPYPIGIYDYKKITGRKFDLKEFSSVKRKIFKGSEDFGGWIITNKNGENIHYTWEKYYEKFVLPELKDKSNFIKINNLNITKLTINDLNTIKYNAFKGKILIDRFIEISDIYSELDINSTEFKVYEEVRHEINSKIKEEEVEFFSRILKD